MRQNLNNITRYVKAVIIEDEIVAADSLKRLISKVNNSIEILAVLQSIEESVEWFDANHCPDLVFMDIHLSDGSSFSIFEKVKILAPVIFTTAYDEYALKAFEVYSIDYLLKPVNIKDLERAIEKFVRLGTAKTSYADAIDNMLAEFKKENIVYKSNFLIPHKDKIIPLPVSDIAFIYSENKIAKITTLDNRNFYEYNSLDELQRQLDPSKFFRVNRQFIISHCAVKDLSIWFDNKLSVNLRVEAPEKIIVNRARVAEFKNWYGKGKS